MPDSCLSDETISLFFDERLTSSEKMRADGHVQACPLCRDSLAAMQSLRTGMRGLSSPAVPAHFAARVLSERQRRREASLTSQRPLAWSLAGAATMAVAVLALVSTQVILQRPSRKSPVLGLTMEATPHKVHSPLSGPAASREVVREVLPEYPDWARKRGIHAYVEISFTVEPEGEVRPDVRVTRSTGYLALDRAGVRALRQWIFSPSHNSQETWGVVTFQFPPRR